MCHPDLDHAVHSRVSQPACEARCPWRARLAFLVFRALDKPDQAITKLPLKTQLRVLFISTAASSAATARADTLVSASAGCHGTDGFSRARYIPTIQGLNFQYFYATMRALNKDQRSSTSMGRIAKGYRSSKLQRLVLHENLIALMQYAIRVRAQMPRVDALPMSERSAPAFTRRASPSLGGPPPFPIGLRDLFGVFSQVVRDRAVFVRKEACDL